MPAICLKSTPSTTLDVFGKSPMKLLSMGSRLIGTLFPTQDRNFSTMLVGLLRASHTTCSTFILSLIYICRVHRAVSITHGADCGEIASIGRLFFASLIIANKYQQERHFSNKAWANLVQLPVSAVNSIEHTFLTLISYDLYVSGQEYDLFNEWLLMNFSLPPM